MKRIFTLIFCAGSILTANAQITSGFYHIINNATERCMIMTDYQKGTSSIQDVDMTAVETSKNMEKVSTHPGAVCWVKPLSSPYCDVFAQNTSIGELTQGKVYPILTSQSDGTYTISGKYSGVTVWIADRAKSGKEDSELYDGSEGNSKTYWKFYAIDNKADGHFIGIKPTVKTADNKYWATLRAGFSFNLGTDMKAYIVDDVTSTEFNLKELTGKIPAQTPVIIQCASDDYSKNIIRPVDISDKGTTSKLDGVFYDRYDNAHFNATTYDKKTMRVLNVDANGNLVFTVASTDYLTNGKYIPHNTAYLSVTSSASETLYVKGASGIRNIEVNSNVESAKEGTYNLGGQRVADDIATPGVYIQNGKKVIIK
jgi:hypothetical protein